jgi:hypothetical protein
MLLSGFEVKYVPNGVCDIKSVALATVEVFCSKRIIRADFFLLNLGLRNQLLSTHAKLVTCRLSIAATRDRRRVI